MRQFISRRGHPAVASLLFAAFLVGVGKRAEAQGIGVQGGFTVDPEQGYVGSHLETGELFPRFRFRPGIDGAFGQDLTLASINVEFTYSVPLGRSSWAFYQGGGPAVLLLRQRVGGSRDTNRSVHAGAFVTFGFAHESGFFTEFKLGSGNSPALRFGVGYTVRKKTP